MFIRRAQNALCHFQTLCRSRRRSRRNARRLRRPASSAVMSPAKLWSPGPSTGESSNREGLPARTPKRPWQLSRGEDEVWTQNSAASVTAFAAPPRPRGLQGAWGWPWSCAWEGTGHIPSIPSLSPLVCLLVLSQRPQELPFPFVFCWWPASRDFLGPGTTSWTSRRAFHTLPRHPPPLRHHLQRPQPPTG